MESAVYAVNIRVVGTRPILQNDLAIMEKSEGEVTKKGKIYDPKEEAEGRLITNKDGLVCQRASHFEGAFIKAATGFKFKGQKTYKDLFKAGVFVDPLLIPHENQEWEIDAQYVVVNRARILRCRPRIDDWSLSFTIFVTEDRIAPATLKNIVEDAGKSFGVGDYRPRYGLFRIDQWEVILREEEQTQEEVPDAIAA